jgi:ABC-type Zn uptake system ZnuABC Zn-binding protein ZnuA
VGLLWLDPVSVQNTSKEICARLRVLRPKFEKEFNQQTADFEGKIEAIDQEYLPKFRDVMTKKVLVMSPDFNPMLQRFGLWPIQPVTTSPMQLDDSGIRALKSASDENGTRVLLVPLDTPDAIGRDIEVRAGLQIVRIDFLGSSGDAGHKSYLNMLRFDLDQLLNATTVR